MTVLCGLPGVLPWPTALAASYAAQGSQAAPAAVLYAATMLLMGLSFAWSWRYLARRPDLVAAPARAAFAAGYRRALLGRGCKPKPPEFLSCSLWARTRKNLVLHVSPTASFFVVPRQHAGQPRVPLRATPQ